MQVDQQEEASATPEAGPSEPVPSSSSAPPPPTTSTTNGTAPAVNGVAVGEDVVMGDALPEGASEVIYINNLNEKIKLDGSDRKSVV